MGHPLAIFLSPPDPNYRCAVCLDAFNDPVSLLRCGHTFCRSCLDSSLARSGRTCPECRAQVDASDDEENDGGVDAVAHPVRVVRRAIGDSIVRCLNCLDENGEWIATTDDGDDVRNTEPVGDEADDEAPDRAADASGNDIGKGNGNNCGDAAAAPDNDDEATRQSPSSSSPPTRWRCEWTGPLSSWPLHASLHCPVAPVACPVLGCGHACPRHALKAHVGSAECVETAVASRVADRMTGLLGDLEREREQMRREMKEEVTRRVAKRVAALEGEKGALEARARREADAMAELRVANRLLRKEVKSLKKRAEGREGHAAATSVGGGADGGWIDVYPVERSMSPLTQGSGLGAGGGGESWHTALERSEVLEFPERKRNRRVTGSPPFASTNPTSSLEDGDENGACGGKRRKRRKKQRKKNRRQSVDDNEPAEEGRMRAVLADSADGDTARISG